MKVSKRTLFAATFDVLLCLAICLRCGSAAIVQAKSTSSATSTSPTTTSTLATPKQPQPDPLAAASGNAALCPNIYRRVFTDSVPRDEFDSGKIDEWQNASGDSETTYLSSCVAACCDKAHNNSCNVVFVFKAKCYHIRCVSNEACLPKSRKDMTPNTVQMVLVSPVPMVEGSAAPSWEEVLKMKSSAEILPYDETNAEPTSANNFWTSATANEQSNRQYPYFSTSDLVGDKLVQPPESNAANSVDYNYDEPLGDPDRPCDLMKLCPDKERCVLTSRNAMIGNCHCYPGYARSHNGICVPVLQRGNLYLGKTKYISAEGLLATKKPTMTTTTAKAEVNKNIVVKATSKQVRLPEKEVTLEAYTTPDETNYKYFWTLIAQPKGPMNGTISDQSKSKVKLSNLSEGLYAFRVSVTGDNGTYGDALANVTVLPQKRNNQPPQVVITPKEQTIRQPTTNAVLDGSSSTDDDKIINWQWEIISGPLGYQPKLPEVNTLQLKDLTAPGNYTFKLTVTDSNNATNSSTANIIVLKDTDYPPVANAGDAIILYLPNNNVTLNGTASSDDHEIVAWEWTKDASDESKAVDMQNTRTPFLKLSNLEEGMYTFVLKVTDGSQQSSTAKVHVFVKPPSNLPPTANAGVNITISLPRNWVLLNGSASKDDIEIKSYRWRQLSGPNHAKILHANATLANATSLTLGIYKFELTVADENNNTDSSVVWVKIVQERNAPPIANAGGDVSITLPVKAVYLNGKKSSDDLRVVKYSWTREEYSLAAGVIVGNTDNESVMILTDLAPGRYVFTLTVSDDQGLTSHDKAVITVHPDPMLKYLVQMTLPYDISTIMQSDVNSVLQKIALLMGDNMHVVMRELKYNLQTSAAVLVFYVEQKNAVGLGNSAVAGHIIESLLKEKLQRDTFILGKLFVDVRSTICQNNCSGHGRCDTATRACICAAFWMPSLGYFIGSDEANCDWSILYVFVSFIVLCLLLAGAFWAAAFSCRRRKKLRGRPRKQKYALIGTRDEELGNFGRSDSDTDSDVLFETRTKPNGILRTNGKAKTRNNTRLKYPGVKSQRKVKT